VEKVSVVMPAYNSEKYISESIDSMINQTYINWELIVVNDGSTDGTKKIIQEYTRKFPMKIRLIDKEKNEGISKGLNSAIKKADGIYICWLSSDDIYSIDMIENEINFLNNNKEFDIVFSNCDFINTDSEFLMSCPKNYYYDELVKGDKTQPYRSLLSKYCLNGCSVMCKKEHYEKIGGFNSKFLYAHDYDMWIRLAANYNIGYINNINVHYRIHPEQGTNLGFNELDSIKSLLDFMRDDVNFNRLLKKAKITPGLEGKIKVLDNVLLRFKNSKREFDLLYEESKSLISFYSEKDSINIDISNNFLLKMELIHKNALIPLENFFENNGQKNWIELLCDMEKLDGFVINSDGARFERFAGNDINRLCMGIKYDNLIVICEMAKEKVNSIIKKYGNDFKWYLASQGTKPFYKMGFSYYMLTEERYTDIFDNEIISITDKDIWNTIMDGLVRLFIVKDDKKL